MNKSQYSENKVYSSTGDSFAKRVFRSSFNSIIIASLLIIIFLGITYRHSGGEFALFGGICFMLFVFVSAIARSIVYLKTIVFNTSEESVLLEIYKYDKVYMKTEYSIRNIHIEIKRVMFIYSSYYLIVYDLENDIRILKQSLVGGWKLDQFQEIVSAMKEMPGYKSIYNQ